MNTAVFRVCLVDGQVLDLVVHRRRPQAACLLNKAFDAEHILECIDSLDSLHCCGCVESKDPQGMSAVGVVRQKRLG